jgi:hypothetical protein
MPKRSIFLPQAPDDAALAVREVQKADSSLTTAEQNDARGPVRSE